MPTPLALSREVPDAPPVHTVAQNAFEEWSVPRVRTFPPNRRVRWVHRDFYIKLRVGFRNRNIQVDDPVCIRLGVNFDRFHEFCDNSPTYWIA